MEGVQAHNLREHSGQTNTARFFWRNGNVKVNHLLFLSRHTIGLTLKLLRYGTSIHLFWSHCNYEEQAATTQKLSITATKPFYKMQWQRQKKKSTRSLSRVHKQQQISPTDSHLWIIAKCISLSLFEINKETN